MWAALTLIRAWIAAGRPKGKKTLGKFEGWAEVMGGILQVAGVPGFLDQLEAFRERDDPETLNICGLGRDLGCNLRGPGDHGRAINPNRRRS